MVRRQRYSDRRNHRNLSNGSQPKTKAGKEAYCSIGVVHQQLRKQLFLHQRRGKIMGLFSSKDTMRSPSAGRVNRAKSVTFTFDGKKHSGFEGDTLASALVANNVHLVGRSFKYHRPRGVASGSEEANALVRVGKGAYAEPNLRATQVEIYEGLYAESQNRFPNLKMDVGDKLYVSAFFPAGFYYKTFMWPASMWMTYEHVIRQAAGPWPCG